MGRQGSKDELGRRPTSAPTALPVRRKRGRVGRERGRGYRGARLLIVISGRQALDDLLWRVRPVVFVRVESPVEFRGSLNEVGG